MCLEINSKNKIKSSNDQRQSVMALWWLPVQSKHAIFHTTLWTRFTFFYDLVPAHHHSIHKLLDVSHQSIKIAFCFLLHLEFHLKSLFFYKNQIDIERRQGLIRNGARIQFIRKRSHTSSELPHQHVSVFHLNAFKKKSKADRFACEMKIEEISMNYECVLHTCVYACGTRKATTAKKCY